ncbi:DUF7260 family protein [Halorientalis litorea]|jgi:hypothetical protein|uniref:DUF7260 family protein n=1 Tax=Halorientalis litorea TaxID=2931977 RepID=UPI001FF52786|nr:hypothetical protein [Halorientalis litorea]
MTVETHIHRARDRVQAERDAVDAKLDAFESFSDRITAIPAETVSSHSPAVLATAGGQITSDTSTSDRCRKVRTAFAETLRPHSVADVEQSESLLATIQNELSDSIAVALAPTTDTCFTAKLKNAVLSATDEQKTKTALMSQVLGKEHRQLDTATNLVDEITDWIADADETPLSQLGYEELQQRHQTLSVHRDRCEEHLYERQTFLQRVTNRNLDSGIPHRSLISYLYQNFSVDHPVLATVARLEDTCATCQKPVRDHLVRRV